MDRNASSRIDFLMKITNTQNAVLAHALNFDASYISRIRSGKRGLPLKQPFIGPASEFFARNVREEYQREALAAELHLKGAWPQNFAQSAQLIADWINGTIARDLPNALGLEPSGNSSRATEQEHDTVSGFSTGSSCPDQVAFYSGNAGRRDAVIAFLSRVESARKPCTLLLQSDEDMAWLYEDEAFAHQWASLMGALVAGGCEVKIVHTLSRDMHEMWEGVRKWLPLYMAGTVQPYYYPRLRDGVRDRSLFVAPGLCAVEANSVRGFADEALVEFIADKRAVAALEREFAAFLSLCRPMMTRVPIQGLSAPDSSVTQFLDAPSPLAAIAEADMLICVKDGHGVLIAKGGDTPSVFFVDETRLICAVAAYLADAKQEQLVSEDEVLRFLQGLSKSPLP